jgi:hypothetical protein
MTTEEQTTATPAGSEQAAHDGPRMPRLPLPRMPIEMPTGTTGRVLWWGGLAALAAFEVVEWPVAVLVGAGSWVAEKYAEADAQRSMRAGHDQPTAEHTSPQV